jgi:hypothetical protein
VFSAAKTKNPPKALQEKSKQQTKTYVCRALYTARTYNTGLLLILHSISDVTRPDSRTVGVKFFLLLMRKSLPSMGGNTAPRSGNAAMHT